MKEIRSATLAKIVLDSAKSVKKNKKWPFLASQIFHTSNNFKSQNRKTFSSKKLSTETLMEEVYTVILEVGKIEFHFREK